MLLCLYYLLWLTVIVAHNTDIINEARDVTDTNGNIFRRKVENLDSFLSPLKLRPDAKLIGMIAPPKIEAGVIIFPNKTAAAGANWSNGEACCTVFLFALPDFVVAVVVLLLIVTNTFSFVVMKDCTWVDKDTVIKKHTQIKRA